MKRSHYILNGHEVVPVGWMEWALWLETRAGPPRIEERRVGYTELEHVRVSTIFLGLDHSFGSGPPLLFETMVFWQNGPRDELCDRDAMFNRYSTWEEAEQGHAKAVEAAREFEAASMAGATSQLDALLKAVKEKTYGTDT